MKYSYIFCTNLQSLNKPYNEYNQFTEIYIYIFRLIIQHGHKNYKERLYIINTINGNISSYPSFVYAFNELHSLILIP